METVSIEHAYKTWLTIMGIATPILLALSIAVSFYIYDKKRKQSYKSFLDERKKRRERFDRGFN